MLTALIVEDEYRICQLITKLVDWKALDIRLLGAYDNGLSALDAIEVLRPDIVVTDIRMPGMDGISLIRTVREREIPCEFIIISGYRQFEYAHSALRFGIAEYLLKPIDKKELTEALTRISARRRSADITQPTGDRRMWEMRQRLRNSFVDKLVTPGTAIELSLETLNEQYHFNFHSDALFRTVLVLFSGVIPDKHESLLSDIVEEVRAVLDPRCWEMIPFVEERGRILFIMNYAPDAGIDELMKDISGIVRQNVLRCGVSAPPFSIGVGREERDIHRLHDTISSAESAAFCGVLRGQNKLYDYSSLTFDALTLGDALPREQAVELRAAAETLNAPAFAAALRSALFKTTSRTDPSVVLDICRTAADILVSAVQSAGYASAGRDAAERMRSGIFAETDYPGFVNYVTSWAEEQIEKCMHERREYGSRPIRTAKKYIAEHYMETLTLEQLAEQVHLNASYFSIIFKKETGQNFSDYLTACRMDAAKRMLRESDMSVAAICEAVGYADTKYFSRIFTKLVGVKPSAYRMLHG